MNLEKKYDVLKLIISIGACLSAGFIGSIFTGKSITTWYSMLQKPSFTPPNWLFAPVWFLLYILMGIAAFLIWRKGIQNHEVKQGLAIFFVQLILNALWSFAFFGLKSPIGGMLVIVPLWTAILLTIIYFFRVSKVAALLLIPYILWVSFATILNFSIYIMNA
jgi:tryptophan-rich sensory protein